MLLLLLLLLLSQLLLPRWLLKLLVLLQFARLVVV